MRNGIANSAFPDGRGAVVWLTGLSGSGKTTLADLLSQRFQSQGYASQVLDGDVLRKGLCRDLGFSPAERKENIRRAGEVAAMFAGAGFIVIAAFISPYEVDRRANRALVPEGAFIEVHLSTSLAECERRDAKGIYKLMRSGMLPSFTGVDSPYEVPTAPELRLDTAANPPSTCVDLILDVLREHGIGNLRVDPHPHRAADARPRR